MSTFYLPDSGGIPEQRRPEIAYPCTWSYTLIGESSVGMELAVRELLAERPHELRLSHTSPHGKYRSLRLEVDVADEPDRLALFAALAAHDAVRFVI